MKKQEWGLCQVNQGKNGFVDEKTGRPFIPFGVNYYDHETGWAPQIWKMFDENRVREQFQLMKSYGVNIARFFIASANFQPEKDRLNPEALEKFDRYLAIAHETGIRVIPTGPDGWEGIPEYAKPDMYSGPEALEALRYYWSQMAVRYRDEPAIFAWDLRNEPMVHWDTPFMRSGWQRFLKEKYKSTKALAEAWDGKLPAQECLEEENIAVPADAPCPDDPRLYDYQLYREQVARTWTKNQVDTIRNAGDQHMVTIGYIQWSFPGYLGQTAPSGYAAFRPSVLSDLLDFDCMHFYPMFGGPSGPEKKLANSRYLLDWLRFCDTSRPIVLEEYGWYGGGAINEHQGYQSLEEQLDWNRHLLEITKHYASGWLSWPFADTRTSTDMSKYGGLVDFDLKPKPWGLFFREFSQQLEQLPSAPDFCPERQSLDWPEKEIRRLLTSGGDASLYWPPKK